MNSFSALLADIASVITPTASLRTTNLRFLRATRKFFRRAIVTSCAAFRCGRRPRCAFVSSWPRTRANAELRIPRPQSSREVFSPFGLLCVGRPRSCAFCLHCASRRCASSLCAARRARRGLPRRKRVAHRTLPPQAVWSSISRSPPAAPCGGRRRIC